MRSNRLFILSGLIYLLLGLLAACGDTAQPGGGGPVPRNTAAPSVTADTPPQITSFDPNQPIPTATPYPTRQPVAGEIPVFGTTIYLFDKITNIAAQENFLEAYGQGKPGQWEVVLYTIEGAPISNQLIYRGTGRQVTLSVDATRDGFSAPEDRVIKEYTCQSFAKTGKTVGMNGCSDGKEKFDWELPVVN